MSGWLIQNTLIAGGLASLVVLASCCRPISPAVRHALWLIVLFKLTTPPLLELSIEVPAWDSYLARSGVSEGAGQAGPPVAARRSLVERLAVEAAPSETVIEEAPQSVAAEPAAETFTVDPPSTFEDTGTEYGIIAKWSPARALQFAWLAGSLLVAVYLVRRIVGFRRALSRTEDAPRWLQEEVGALAARMRLSAPRIRVVPGLAGPLVWALGRPRLLWPAGLESQVEREGVTAILVHELAHLRRRDHWVRRLEVLLSCVWWWHPLLWIVRRQLDETAEQACDAWVVSLEPESRRRYAAALVDVCEMRASVSVPVPALGVSSRARRCFERRLTMILRDRVACEIPRSVVPVLAVLALLVLPAWTLAQPSATETPPAGPVAVDSAADTFATEPFAPTTAAPATYLLEPPTVSSKPAEVVPPRVVGQPAKVRPTVESASMEERVRSATQADVRVESLEKQLRAVLRELEQLKAAQGQARKSEPRIPTMDLAPRPPIPAMNPYRADVPQYTPNYRVQTLQRAAFELPEEKATALGEFLKQFGPEDVEVRVEGNGIIVTTTEESLRAIAQFVELLGRTEKSKLNVPTTYEAAPADKSTDGFRPR